MVSTADSPGALEAVAPSPMKRVGRQHHGAVLSTPSARLPIAAGGLMTAPVAAPQQLEMKSVSWVLRLRSGTPSAAAGQLPQVAAVVHLCAETLATHCQSVVSLRIAADFLAAVAVEAQWNNHYHDATSVAGCVMRSGVVLQAAQHMCAAVPGYAEAADLALQVLNALLKTGAIAAAQIVEMLAKNQNRELRALLDECFLPFSCGIMTLIDQFLGAHKNAAPVLFAWFRIQTVCETEELLLDGSKYWGALVPQLVFVTFDAEQSSYPSSVAGLCGRVVLAVPTVADAILHVCTDSSKMGPVTAVQRLLTTACAGGRSLLAVAALSVSMQWDAAGSAPVRYYVPALKGDLVTLAARVISALAVVLSANVGSACSARACVMCLRAVSDSTTEVLSGYPGDIRSVTIFTLMAVSQLWTNLFSSTFKRDALPKSRSGKSGTGIAGAGKAADQDAMTAQLLDLHDALRASSLSDTILMFGVLWSRTLLLRSDLTARIVRDTLASIKRVAKCRNYSDAEKRSIALTITASLLIPSRDSHVSSVGAERQTCALESPLVRWFHSSAAHGGDDKLLAELDTQLLEEVRYFLRGAVGTDSRTAPDCVLSAESRALVLAKASWWMLTTGIKGSPRLTSLFINVCNAVCTLACAGNLSKATVVMTEPEWQPHHVDGVVQLLSEVKQSVHASPPNTETGLVDLCREHVRSMRRTLQWLQCCSHSLLANSETAGALRFLWRAARSAVPSVSFEAAQLLDALSLPEPNCLADGRKKSREKAHATKWNPDSTRAALEHVAMRFLAIPDDADAVGDREDDYAAAAVIELLHREPGMSVEDAAAAVIHPKLDDQKKSFVSFDVLVGSLVASQILSQQAPVAAESARPPSQPRRRERQPSDDATAARPTSFAMLEHVIKLVASAAQTSGDTLSSILCPQEASLRRLFVLKQHVTSVAVVALSSLDRTVATYAKSEDTEIPTRLSPFALRHVSRQLTPLVMFQLVDAALTMPTAFGTSLTLASSGRNDEHLATALRINLARIYDARSAVSSALSAKLPQRDAVSIRKLLWFDLWRAAVHAMLVTIQGSSPASGLRDAVLGHCDGVGAIVERLGHELFKVPTDARTPSKGQPAPLDASILSEFGKYSIELTLAVLQATTGFYQSGNHRALLLQLDRLILSPFEGRSDPYLLAAAIVMFADAQFPHVVVRLGCLALRATSISEEAPMRWFAALKSNLRAGYRRWSKDPELKATREYVLEAGHVTKVALQRLRRDWLRDFPVSFADADAPIRSGAHVLCESPTGVVFDVCPKRSSWTAVALFECVVHIRRRRVSLEQGWGCTSAASCTATDDVDDKCREAAERVLLASDGDDDDEVLQPEAGRQTVVTWEEMLEAVVESHSRGAAAHCHAHTQEELWLSVRQLLDTPRTAEAAHSQAHLWMSLGGPSAVVGLTLDVDRVQRFSIAPAGVLDVQVSTVISMLEGISTLNSGHRVLLAHTLVDWTRFCLVPGTRMEEERRSEILERLCAAIATDDSPSMLSWMKALAYRVSDVEHSTVVLRHVAAYAQNTHLNRGSHPTPQQVRDAIQLVCDVIDLRSLPLAERSHWAARLIVRISQISLDDGCWELVANRAASALDIWLSETCCEVLLSSVVRLASSGDDRNVSAFATLLGMLTADDSRADRCPGFLFQLNVIRQSHPRVFHAVAEQLRPSLVGKLDALQRYTQALHALASTAPELASAFLSDVRDLVEDACHGLQEVGVELDDFVQSPAAPSRAVPAPPSLTQLEKLPQLGEASTSTQGATSGNPIDFGSGGAAQADALEIVAVLRSQVERATTAYESVMDKRAECNEMTWVDKSTWYHEESGKTHRDLPSVHPRHTSGIVGLFLGQLRACIERSYGAVSNAPRCRRDGDTARNVADSIRTATELLRHEACSALHDAAEAVHQLISRSVVPFFSTSAGGATLDDVFCVVPEVLKGPFPCRLVDSSSKAVWTLDSSAISLQRSQVCPRNIVFRAVEKKGRNNNKGATELTANFILKGATSRDHVKRDRAIVLLMREIQRFADHEASNVSNKGCAVAHFLRVLDIKGCSIPATPAGVPYYNIFPFASGGGLIERLTHYTPVSAVVEEWKSSTSARLGAKDDNERKQQPLSLLPPAVQMRETLRIVIDEINVAHSKQAGVGRGARTEVATLQHPPPAAVKEAFLRLLRAQPSSRDVLTQLLVTEAPDGEPHCTDLEWVKRWSSYSRSLAAGSALTFLLGIGDRHLGNLLFNRKSGCVAHIDFSVCFGEGARLRFPERVPFRMTPVLMQPLGPYGCEGAFAHSLDAFLATVASNETLCLELMTALHSVAPLTRSNHRSSARPRVFKRMLTDSVNQVVHRTCQLLMEELAPVLSDPKNPGSTWLFARNQLLAQSRFRQIVNSGKKLQALLHEQTEGKGDVSSRSDVHSADAQYTHAQEEVSSARRALRQGVIELSRIYRTLKRDVEDGQTAGTRQAFEAAMKSVMPHAGRSDLLPVLITLDRLPTSLRVSSLSNAQRDPSDSLWQLESSVLPASSGPTIVEFIPCSHRLSMACDAPCEEIFGRSSSRCCHPIRVTLDTIHDVVIGCGADSLVLADDAHAESWQCDSAPDALIASQSEEVRSHPSGSVAPSVVDNWIAVAAELLSEISVLPATTSPGEWSTFCEAIVAGWCYAVDSTRDAQRDSPAEVAERLVEAFADVMQLQFPHFLFVRRLEASGSARERLCAAVRSLSSRPETPQINANFLQLGASPFSTVAERDDWYLLSPMTAVKMLVSWCEILLEDTPHESARTFELVVVQCCRQRTLVVLQALCWHYVAHHLAASDRTFSAARGLAVEWVARVASVASARAPLLLSVDVRQVANDTLEPLALDVVSAVLNAASQDGSHTGKWFCLWGRLPTLVDVGDRIAAVQAALATLIQAHASRSRCLEQRNKVLEEKLRSAQRASLIQNQRKALSDMLKQCISPVTLNSMSTVMGRLRHAIEALHHEVQSTLIELFLTDDAAKRGKSSSTKEAAKRLVQSAASDVSACLNRIHLLAAEGYEVVAARVSRGGSTWVSQSKKAEGQTTGGDEVALSADVDELLRIIDAAIVLTSVDLVSQMHRLYGLLSAAGVRGSRELADRVQMLKATLSTAGVEIAAAYDADSGDAVTSASQPAVPRYVQLAAAVLARSKAQLQAVCNPSEPETSELSTLLEQSELLEVLSDFVGRLHFDPSSAVPPPERACSKAKFLVGRSIDADVLAGMYPGWTAWI